MRDLSHDLRNSFVCNKIKLFSLHKFEATHNIKMQSWNEKRNPKTGRGQSQFLKL